MVVTLSLNLIMKNAGAALSQPPPAARRQQEASFRRLGSVFPDR